MEHDTHQEVTYIDGLIEKYGHGRKRRVGWRADTLFIVNKFDKQINRSPASSLIEYMKYCQEYGQTVLTIMNAKGKNTANMSQMQLNQFVLTVESDEEEKWSEVLREFMKMDDDDLEALKKLKREIAGIGKMNEILAKKMCDIVKKILPSVERQLDLAELEKRNEIAGIMKQIDMCDPQKLKGQCIEFNNSFLKNLRLFYNGNLVKQLDKKYKKSWQKEVEDFHLMANRAGNKWEYEIAPGKLRRLLSRLKMKEKPAELLNKLDMEFIASAAIIRIINCWVAMVSLMAFPTYTDEDIHNICGAFAATKQPDIWESVRNVVFDAVRHLTDAATFLGEFLRYKIKENAEIVFEFTLMKQFQTKDLHNNPIIKLLDRTLRDYKAECDLIIQGFIDVAMVVPEDQCKILDKNYCEETINAGKLINKLLNPQNKIHHANIKKPSPKPYTANYSKNTKNSSNFVPPPPMTGQPPPPKGQPKPPQNVPGPPNASPIKQSTTQSAGGKKQRKGTSANNSSKQQQQEENKDDSKQQEQYENAYNQTKYDQVFYAAIHAQKVNHPIMIGAADYDIPLIRHLAYTFWATIKHVSTRDIQQKSLNLVMAPVNHHDERLSTAVHCGVDSRQLQALIHGLVKKTGVDVLALESLIKNKSSVQIPKAINDLDNKELEEIYGINRETLLEIKNSRVKQLKEFKKLKAQTLVKIYHIKNGTVDEIEEGGDDDEKIDIEEEDDSDIYNAVQSNGNMNTVTMTDDQYPYEE